MEKSLKKQVTMCDMVAADGQTTADRSSSCTTLDICRPVGGPPDTGGLHPFVEWRRYNEELLGRSVRGHHRSNVVDYNVQRAINTLSGSVDKCMLDSTNRIAGTAGDVYRWRENVFLVLEAVRNEIGRLLSSKRKLQKAQTALGVVCSISAECLERRSFRLNMDSTLDPGQVELVKERELINEIGNLMCRTLCRLQDQLQRNKCIKHRLEENWSDKNRSLRIDAANLGLNIQSPLIMSHGDVVGDDPENTTLLSVPEWEAAANGLKNKADGVLNDSALLRSAIDDMLEQNAKRLRCQADAVDIALARFISDTRQVGNRIEVDLEQVVQRLGASENLVDDLLRVITNLEKAKNTAETRLHNRLKRPVHENCNDNAQLSLVSEARRLEEQLKTLDYQLQCARTGHLGLQEVRSQLEDEARVKRKTLWIDTVKCHSVRAHYPSVNVLIGH